MSTGLFNGYSRERKNVFWIFKKILYQDLNCFEYCFAKTPVSIWLSPFLMLQPVTSTVSIVFYVTNLQKVVHLSSVELQPASLKDRIPITCCCNLRGECLYGEVHIPVMLSTGCPMWEIYGAPPELPREPTGCLIHSLLKWLVSLGDVLVALCHILYIFGW